MVAPADADAEPEIEPLLLDTLGAVAVAALNADLTLDRVPDPVTVASTLEPPLCGSPLKISRNTSPIAVGAPFPPKIVHDRLAR
jgi:hypothetical protein